MQQWQISVYTQAVVLAAYMILIKKIKVDNITTYFSLNRSLQSHVCILLNPFLSAGALKDKFRGAKQPRNCLLLKLGTQAPQNEHISNQGLIAD